MTASTLRASFARRVVEWQRVHGRHDLPWQRPGVAGGRLDPYRVWLSEVMLQQTQVAVVRPFFERFVARFPDVSSLAAASEDAVLALWSGLGYYSRARHLHRAARAIVEAHGGAFPPSSAALATLPGVGRSTAAAIAAFSFGERVAILDGNVKRVLARVLAFDGDLAEPRRVDALWNEATALLPKQHVDRYTQGLMDLGATVCLPRRPHCLVCPVRDLCAAARAGDPERFPVKTRRLVRRTKRTAWLELRWQGRIWLVRRPSRGVWAGLWSLPEFDTTEALAAAAASWPGEGEAERPFLHVLTHLDWHLQPVRWTLPSRASARAVAAVTSAWPDGRWFDVAEALALGIASPLRQRLAVSA